VPLSAVPAGHLRGSAQGWRAALVLWAESLHMRLGCCKSAMHVQYEGRPLANATARLTAAVSWGSEHSMPAPAKETHDVWRTSAEAQGRTCTAVRTCWSSVIPTRHYAGKQGCLQLRVCVISVRGGNKIEHRPLRRLQHA
jgi:hypothetical protein